MTKRTAPESTDGLREAIATYVMAQPDSSLVKQLAAALGRNVDVAILQKGDPFITGRVRDVLQGADIAVVEDTQGDTSPSKITVPTYMDRGAVDKKWDRPLIVAQAVGEAIVQRSDAKKLRLGSFWLWFIMSYEKWRDVAHLRQFVGQEIDQAVVMGWDYIDINSAVANFQ